MKSFKIVRKNNEKKRKRKRIENFIINEFCGEIEGLRLAANAWPMRRIRNVQRKISAVAVAAAGALH